MLVRQRVGLGGTRTITFGLTGRGTHCCFEKELGQLKKQSSTFRHASLHAKEDTIMFTNRG